MTSIAERKPAIRLSRVRMRNTVAARIAYRGHWNALILWLHSQWPDGFVEDRSAAGWTIFKRLK